MPRAQSGTKLIIRLVADTGLRVGELLGLRTNDLVEQNRNYYLHVRGVERHSFRSPSGLIATFIVVVPRRASLPRRTGLLHHLQHELALPAGNADAGGFRTWEQRFWRACCG